MLGLCLQPIEGKEKMFYSFTLARGKRARVRPAGLSLKQQAE